MQRGWSRAGHGERKGSEQTGAGGLRGKGVEGKRQGEGSQEQVGAPLDRGAQGTGALARRKGREGKQVR